MINLIGAYVIGFIALAFMRHPLPLGQWNTALRESAWGLSRGVILILLLLLAIARYNAPAPISLMGIGLPAFIFSGLNLWLHEAGHGFLMFMPRFVMVAGGTLFELGIPLLFLSVWLYRRYDELLPLGIFWFGYNATHVGPYIADARARVLPLLGGGGHANHDWHFMLSATDLLEYDKSIGGVVSACGFTFLIAGVALWAFPQLVRRWF